MLLCLGRQFGSGGHQIANIIGSKLGMTVYDKSLLAEAAEESGIKTRYFEQADEQTHFARASRWLSSHVPLFFGAFGTNDGLTNQMLFQIQSDTIRLLAEKDNAIFLGRCADYILRDKNNMLSVFITADIDDRVQRIAAKEKMSEEEALKKIKRVERQRKIYYNFYTEKRWGRAASYDLCVNSSILGIEKTADFIAEFIRLSSRDKAV